MRLSALILLFAFYAGLPKAEAGRFADCVRAVRTEFHVRFSIPKRVRDQAALAASVDVETSLILRRNYPNLFKGKKPGYAEIARAIAARSISSWRPFGENNLRPLASPAFRTRVCQKLGFTDHELDQLPLNTITERLYGDGYSQANWLKDWLQREQAVLKDYSRETQLKVAHVFEAIDGYHDDLSREYAAGSKFWDVSAGTPPYETLPNGEGKRFLLDVGDRILLESGEVQILEFLGTGGEHTVFKVKSPSGASQVLKVGGHSGKVEQRDLIASRGLPVLELQSVGPGFFLVEEYSKSGKKVIGDIVKGTSDMSQLEPFISVYAKYLKSGMVISDLHMDNLGVVGNQVKISDWYTCAGSTYEAGSGFGIDYRSRHVELSQQLGKSIWIAFLEIPDITKPQLTKLIEVGKKLINDLKLQGMSEVRVFPFSRPPHLEVVVIALEKRYSEFP